MTAMKNDATRNDRLKAALRDNLRRRKAQGRVRGQPRPEPAGPDAAEAEDASRASVPDPPLARDDAG